MLGELLSHEFTCEGSHFGGQSETLTHGIIFQCEELPDAPKTRWKYESIEYKHLTANHGVHKQYKFLKFAGRCKLCQATGHFKKTFHRVLVCIQPLHRRKSPSGHRNPNGAKRDHAGYRHNGPRRAASRRLHVNDSALHGKGVPRQGQHLPVSRIMLVTSITGNWPREGQQKTPPPHAHHHLPHITP